MVRLEELESPTF